MGSNNDGKETAESRGLNGNMTKPISTSSPAGLAAAQMVTPSKLSALLLERGPLAIRHITQTLGSEIPSFKDLSSSKQRRLIMSAMEAGDRDNNVVFAKIGWGQWSAKKIDPDRFFEERDATNAANAKIKDIVSQESQRRRSSSSNGARRPQLNNGSSSSGSGMMKKPSATAKNTTAGPLTTDSNNVVYIDENAVASEDEEDREEDEEEEEEEDDEDNDDENEFLMNPIKREDLFSFRRRMSSVVFADSSPEDREHELLAQRVRPLLKNRSRRSSSKIRTSSVSKNGAVHLDLPQSDTPGSTSRHNSNAMIDLEQVTNSISEPGSRRESRLSFSKESGIRSTLLSHRNYHWLPTSSSPRLSYQKNTSQVPSLSTVSMQNKNKSTGSVNKTKKSGTAKNTQTTSNTSTGASSNCPHSDTDEEDWAAIGAAKLRNNSVPPRMETLANSPNGFVAPNVPDVNSIPSLDKNLPPPAMEDSQGENNPNDENSAAFLLMSLKS